MTPLEQAEAKVREIIDNFWYKWYNTPSNNPQKSIDEYLKTPIAKQLIQSLVSEGAGRWVSVNDKPLIEWYSTDEGRMRWTTTDAGEREFIAAVPYNDKTKPGKELWWIKHCLIEEVGGLHVIGEDDNEPAGWEVQDITHYILIPPNPNQQSAAPPGYTAHFKDEQSFIDFLKWQKGEEREDVNTKK